MWQLAHDYSLQCCHTDHCCSLASFPGLLTPAFVTCSANVGEVPCSANVGEVPCSANVGEVLVKFITCSDVEERWVDMLGGTFPSKPQRLSLSFVASSGSTAYTRCSLSAVYTAPDLWLCRKLQVNNHWTLELQNVAEFPGFRFLHSCGAAF